MAGNENHSETKELAYDLRQQYAVIVGEHIMDVAENRKQGDFYNWFKSMEDLKTVVQHKFKNKEKTIERYGELVKGIKILANKYSSTWTRKGDDAEEYSKIDASLRELEEFLYEEMERGKVFGEGGRQVSF